MKTLTITPEKVQELLQLAGNDPHEFQVACHNMLLHLKLNFVKDFGEEWIANLDAETAPGLFQVDTTKTDTNNIVIKYSPEAYAAWYSSSGKGELTVKEAVEDAALIGYGVMPNGLPEGISQTVTPVPVWEWGV